MSEFTTTASYESADRATKVEIGTLENGACGIRLSHVHGRYEDGAVASRYENPTTVVVELSNADNLAIIDDIQAIYDANNPPEEP